ncbi:MAG: potassium channel family protein [Gemmataceae bacterium]
MDRTILLCGLGRVGWRVLNYLQNAGFAVVIIDTEASPNDKRLEGVRLIKGDCRQEELLHEAGVEHARGVIIVTNDDFLNVSTALSVRALNPKVRIVIRLFNDNLIENLAHIAPRMFPLSIPSLTAPILAARTLPGEVLGTFRVEGPQPDRWQISQLTIPSGSALIGKNLHQIAKENNVRLLSYLPRDDDEKYLRSIDQSRRLRAKDAVVVCGTPANLTNLVRQTEDTFLELRWASYIRRLIRMVKGTFHEIDLLLKVCFLVLVLVVSTSTLLFVFIGQESVPNALYHTVSIMATMADMRENQEELKIYVSLLRFVGAALTAAFTAILTRYLLAASLRGALEVRRIPEEGHVIVCGLDSIGFRLVEELSQSNERVVVVESRSDNNFVPTVRRNGVPVIIGDASVGEVLRQARVATSRAVVICTNNDIVNLEIAMLAVKLNPKQKIIPLQSDPKLEELLHKATNIRNGVSIPTVAAPAFVAGLFGDRVQTIFQIRERLFAVIDILVHLEEGEHGIDSATGALTFASSSVSMSSLATQFFGQPVLVLAMDYQLIPLAVLPADPELTPPANPMTAKLGPGDRLVAILSWSNLERLLRRQPGSAVWSIEITMCPSDQKEWLVSLLVQCKVVSDELATTVVEQLPYSFEAKMTVGQAEHLRSLLEEKGIVLKTSRRKTNEH